MDTTTTETTTTTTSTVYSEEQQLAEMRLEVLGSVEDKSKDDVFKIKLKQAKYIALNTLYPYSLTTTDLPERITNDWQIRCALELYYLMGQEGYTSYSENGLSWTKDSSLLSTSLMRELTSNVGVPR